LETPGKDAIIKDLKTQDPGVARIDDLPQSYRDREAYFVGNTIGGMLDYLRGA
jgi:hypothetical protein